MYNYKYTSYALGTLVGLLTENWLKAKKERVELNTKLFPPHLSFPLPVLMLPAQSHHSIQPSRFTQLSIGHCYQRPSTNISLFPSQDNNFTNRSFRHLTSRTSFLLLFMFLISLVHHHHPSSSSLLWLCSWTGC